jgi:hypothetical protein
MVQIKVPGIDSPLLCPDGAPTELVLSRLAYCGAGVLLKGGKRVLTPTLSGYYDNYFTGKLHFLFHSFCRPEPPKFAVAIFVIRICIVSQCLTLS